MTIEPTAPTIPTDLTIDRIDFRSNQLTIDRIDTGGSAPGRRRHARSRAHARMRARHEESLESLESLEDPESDSIEDPDSIDSRITKVRSTHICTKFRVLIYIDMLIVLAKRLACYLAFLGP